MKKEEEFFLYLIEKYAEYKNLSTTEVVDKLDGHNVLEYVYDMYEMYHIEAIENAFDDIDKLIED